MWLAADRWKLTRAHIFVCALFVFMSGPSAALEKVLLYSITEELPTDTFIANLMVDYGLVTKYPANVQSRLSFVFLKEIQNLELFSLDERNGILRTGRVIDRDVVCPAQLDCTIQLDLAVQPSAYFEIIKVEITILDVNDNGPTFGQLRVRLVIPENTPPGESFSLPTASDVDSLPNGVVEYRLLSITNHFQLNVKNDSSGKPKELWLTLLRDLDREEQDHYELTMVAYDGGLPRRSSILAIDVQVGDVNDNSPKFDKEVYDVSISENTSIGATIVRLSASDADVGPNGHVRYRFSQRSEANYGDLFAIDPENGDVVLLQTLNHALQNAYNLGLVAEDQGDYSIPGLAALIVTVVDINDHAPQIIIDALSVSGSVEVYENADVGTFVAHISTYDKDGGDNGLVRCSVNNNNNFKLIQIYEGEYKLVTARVFDRETMSRYEVVIRCHDMGQPRMHVNKAIIVNVADVNDNHPVFTYSVYNATVQENLSWGTFLVRVSAHDPDEGSNGEIAYMLDSDADHRFHIDPDTGVVTTLTGLDRELSDYIEFHVLAANKGEHSLVSRAMIRVNITDVDDESPKFSSSQYLFEVFENQPSRTEVGQIMAVDRDLPPFNAFSFVIRNSKTFAIDPKSGIIYTRRTLDRELEDRYEVLVEVLSNTVLIKQDSVLVVIRVLDTNDNTPNITFPNEFNHTVFVSSILNLFEVVCAVQSFDLDDGINSELSYEISGGNGTSYFGIEPVTGQIRLLRELLQSINLTFMLVVKVTDGGEPAQHSLSLLYLTVVDGNLLALSGLPRMQTLWSWLSDTRLVIVASITAICFVLVILLVTAILLVRRRNSRRRAKTQVTMETVKIEMMEGYGTREEEDETDTLNRMKLMMNDGKMVRMEEISYTEINADVTCNVSCQSLDVPFPSIRSCGKSGAARIEDGGVRLNVAAPICPVTFDPDADSGCADVSHCNDDLSSGSERSSKDAETVLIRSERFISSDDRHVACPPPLPRLSNQNSPKATTVISPNDLGRDDVQKVNIIPSPVLPPVSSSSSPNAPSSGRKSVRFADESRFRDPRFDVAMPDDCGKTEQVPAKIQTYVHQYPSRAALTTFLPEEGSLV